MQYDKGKLINDGGEGCIYEVPGYPNLLMKIYNEKDMLGNPVVTDELQQKLVFMHQNPPEELISAGTVAWPLELLYDDSDNITGFIMPRMNYDSHISHAYNYVHPKHEAEKYRDFPSVESRINIAINLCSALYALHNIGYVVGDFNHDNIGVSYSTGKICLMDCDSFHITDNDRNVYRTNVIMQGYLAPEIIIHCNNEKASGRPFNLDDVALPTFTKESDLFCLAVHIFKLLMNGADPFRGRLQKSENLAAVQPLGNDAIEQNLYVFREGYEPSAVFCPPATALPHSIISAFNDAFLLGRENPSIRPDSSDWYYILEQYQQFEITQCKKSQKHQYYKALKACPYCIADGKMKDALKGKKKWHESISIVASICAFFIIGGFGVGAVFTLIGSPDTVNIVGGVDSTAVELWHDWLENPPQLLLQPLDPGPKPKPTPNPTPEPPPEGTSLYSLWYAIFDLGEDISLVIEWHDNLEDSGEREFTVFERASGSRDWFMHDGISDERLSVQPEFEYDNGSVIISRPYAVRANYYLHEDGTGVFAFEGEGRELTWRLGVLDSDLEYYD